MRLQRLFAAVGALLLIGVALDLPGASPGEGDPTAPDEMVASAVGGEALIRVAADGGSDRAHAVAIPLSISLADVLGIDDGTRAVDRGAASWAERLGGIDGWLNTMGVGLNASERLQEQLVAVHTVHAQPLDPAPWADAPVRTTEKQPPSVTASAAVVLDEASAAVLYGKNQSTRLPPASTTKIATLILAVERGGLDDEVENTVDSRQMPGSSLMGLLPGDRFTLREVLYGLMLPSGNDAALAVGRHVSGSDAAFMEEIDRLLKRLRLHDTKFIDPHGLGRGGGHYSTAIDMALLARYGMQMPEFAEIVGTASTRVNGTRRMDLRNTNQFLTRYEGADGVKTGFTYAGGPTFVGSATRDGRRLYVVLLNSQDRPGEAAKLLDWAFENHGWTAQGPAQRPAQVVEQQLDDDGVIEAAGVR